MSAFKYKLIGFGSIVFFIVLIISLIYLRMKYIDENGIKPKEPQTIINDQTTYEQSWRSPRGSEYAEIGKLIVQNNITICGEYHVKEVSPGEYVIACSPDGTNWQYFVAYTAIGKFYRASDEMVTKLTPPR
ncbi:MAG: hypothetical protein K0M50_21170 [Prolixibacteraceae bacterium]|nr:hypothetical protein [Prolixibacteraceae bacterium]